ncbi:MAG: hypothetical protein CMG93_11605 [Marinomonas sp.]|nr:hypothetical protein [Marinomonas sp.]
MITSSPLMSPVTASVKQSKPLAGSSNESEGSFASTFQKAVYEDQQEAKSTAASAPSEKTQSNQSSNQSESLPAEGNEQVEAVDAVADSEASESAPTSPQTASEDIKGESEKGVVTDGEEVSGGNVEQLDRQDLAGENLSKEQNLEDVEPAAELNQAENEEVLNSQDQITVDDDRVEQSELASQVDVKTQSDSGQSRPVENELDVEKVKETSSLESAEEPDKQSLPFSDDSDEQIAAGDSENMDADKVEKVDTLSEFTEQGQLKESGKPLSEVESTSLNTQQKGDASAEASAVTDGESVSIQKGEEGQAQVIAGQHDYSVVVEDDIDSAITAEQKDASVANTVAGSAALSSNTTARDASASGLERATENLRLMMEQMSKQGAAASTNTNATLSQSLSSDAKFESGALVQVEGELIQADTEDGLISKNIDNLLGDKKSFEQILSSLGSVSQQGQLNSSLFSTVASTTAARNDSLAAQLTMQSMPDAQAFPNEMATKVAWVAKEGFKVAHIQLDPPELGSLAVKVSVDQDSNTHVSFVASSAQAKDALEGQMQRLRDMLQQQGLELDSVDVEVSQGNGQAFGSNNSDHASGGSQSDTGLVSDSDGLDDDLDNVTYVSPAEQGIDYYA